MKIIAKNVVQLGGHIYGRGEACEYNGPLTERIIANFTAADGGVLSVTPVGPDAESGERGGERLKGEPGECGVDIIERTIDTLKREGIARQLDEMGVTYPPNANTKYLAKLLLISKGELSATED